MQNPQGQAPTKKPKDEKAPSKVYIVGAGPGHPKLLTLRAKELLETCDIILHDKLIHPQVLSYAKAKKCLGVGKTPGLRCPTQRQNRIQKLMIAYSYAGWKVLRLKGGDPFIFGRGGEELLALAKAKIPYEIVPGLSSFYAAPGQISLPITHRGIANSFAVFTAHPDPKSKMPDIDWSIAASIPTAIFLMGVKRLGSIVSELLKAGRKAESPVTIISNASFDTQRVFTGNLGNIQNHTQGLQAPAVIVVGEVARLPQLLQDLSQD